MVSVMVNVYLLLSTTSAPSCAAGYVGTFRTTDLALIAVFFKLGFVYNPVMFPVWTVVIIAYVGSLTVCVMNFHVPVPLCGAVFLPSSPVLETTTKVVLFHVMEHECRHPVYC